MTTATKPTNKAFVLNPDKKDEFFSDKSCSARKTLERFFTNQPKEGVKTPYKGKDV